MGKWSMWLSTPESCPFGSGTAAAKDKEVNLTSVYFAKIQRHILWRREKGETDMHVSASLVALIHGFQASSGKLVCSGKGSAWHV